MKLTKEEALKYHRQMWSDMQKELGDNPSPDKRLDFKGEWCYKHFPNEYINNSCFCCEYNDQYEEIWCYHCPIAWPTLYDDEPNCCRPILHGNEFRNYYLAAPISEILALPERKVEDEQSC